MHMRTKHRTDRERDFFFRGKILDLCVAFITRHPHCRCNCFCWKIETCFPFPWRAGAYHVQPPWAAGNLGIFNFKTAAGGCGTISILNPSFSIKHVLVPFCTHAVYVDARTWLIQLIQVEEIEAEVLSQASGEKDKGEEGEGTAPHRIAPASDT